MYEGNPREIDVGSSYRDSTVHVNILLRELILFFFCGGGVIFFLATSWYSKRRYLDSSLLERSILRLDNVKFIFVLLLFQSFFGNSIFGITCFSVPNSILLFCACSLLVHRIHRTIAQSVNLINITLLFHFVTPSSVDRAPSQCTGGHGFDSR